MKTQGFLLKYPEGKSEINLEGDLPTKDLIITTWQELKDKRDAGKLIPGSLYRITDYQCTTTQENTRSAGHQFDIVLLALSENKLAEEGWAMEHPTDVYDVTFSDNVTLKCYVLTNNDDGTVIRCDTLMGMDSLGVGEEDDLEINAENKTAIANFSSTQLTTPNLQYNYFQKSNLSAWKVWYCLDNDRDRFSWADDSVDESSPESVTFHNNKGFDMVCIRNTEKDTENLYAWTDAVDDTHWTDTLTPTIEDNVYNQLGQIIPSWSIASYTPAHEGTGLPNGRGVIYRLIDEFNNDIKYDFKNIQFVRKLTDGQYNANGPETWCYTLNIWYNGVCQDASIVGNTLPNDEGFVTGVYNNNFGYTTAYNLNLKGVNTFAFALGDNVVLSFLEDDVIYYGIFSNMIGDGFHSNTIGDYFVYNTILSNFNHNTIGNNFYCNKIGNDFFDNTIGNDFLGNIIGNSCNSNTIGSSVNSNTFGNGFNSKTVSDNTIYKNYGNNGVELATKDDLN